MLIKLIFTEVLFTIFTTHVSADKCIKQIGIYIHNGIVFRFRKK